MIIFTPRYLPMSFDLISFLTINYVKSYKALALFSALSACSLIPSLDLFRDLIQLHPLSLMRHHRLGLVIICLSLKSILLFAKSALLVMTNNVSLLKCLTNYSQVTTLQYLHMVKKRTKIFRASLKSLTCETQLFFLILNVFLIFYLII